MSSDHLKRSLDRSANLQLAPDRDHDDGAMALVAGLRAGSPGARRDVVRAYGGHVRAILVRLLGAHEQERSDLLQDVFLRVFEGIDRLETPEALKAWLSRITVFVAREHIRRL